MKLVPVVVLIDDDTERELRPHVARIEAAMGDQADMIVELMRQRGWTPEMLAWSTLMRTVADALRSGAFAFEVKPRVAPDPTETAP